MENRSLDLAIATVDRLEAERRLRSLPPNLLESAWALEAQAEAVVDALLVATAQGERGYAHARHVGEWAARIVAELSFAPSSAYMRRCGVLADIDPAIVERVREIRECAPVVRAFQRLRMAVEGPGEIRTAALIVAVADEFDTLVFDCDDEHRHSPNDALRMMIRCANDEGRPIVDALRRSTLKAANVLPAIA